MIFLAVHPPAAPQVLQELQGRLPGTSVLVSFVPTLTISKLTAALGGFARLVRMIPNAPSVVAQGFNPVVFHPSIGGEDKSKLLYLFSLWGSAPEVDERLLEAYAIVTGMDPTYFWFQWLELLRLAREFGLEEPAARAGLAGMLHGAVAAPLESDSSPAEVLDLIPVHPLKESEATMQQIFREKLVGLHAKLTAATKR